MQAFEQAMANQNHQLGKTLERMGMSMAEFVEHMKEKDKKPVEDPVVVSSAPPPPPPPGAGAAPVEFQIGTPRARSRSRSAVADPVSAQRPTPIRDPSVASTIRYPSAQPEAPREQVARAAVARELQRSRSRGGPGPEIILPIEEEGPRGRSQTRKPPMADKAKALLRKQEQGISMGEARIHLGRFAKNLARVRQEAKNAEKAASVPPPPKQKTYDDIEKEIDEVVPDITDTRLRKKPQFPEGAFLKRNRMDSAGTRGLRYQGMPIKV